MHVEGKNHSQMHLWCSTAFLLLADSATDIVTREQSMKLSSSLQCSWTISHFSFPHKPLPYLLSFRTVLSFHCHREVRKMKIDPILQCSHLEDKKTGIDSDCFAHRNVVCNMCVFVSYLTGKE